MIKKWLKRRRERKKLLNATTYAIYLMIQKVRPEKALQLTKERYKVPIKDIVVALENCMNENINEDY